MNKRRASRTSLNRGQLIIEAMIAITLLSVGLLGLFTLLTRAYSMQQRMADRYVATYLAAEGIELVKNQLDTNVIQKRAWNEGYTVNGDYGMDFLGAVLNPALATQPLKFDSASGLYNYQTGNNTSYRRALSITNVTADEIRIVSKVTWSDKNGKPAEIVLEDHFYNWR